MQLLRRFAPFGALLVVIFSLSGPAAAAPYAAMVIDARTGEVVHSRNADTRLHPASLTKMMTLYVAFEAVRRGEIGLDDRVRISSHAASEPPSKLGLRSGQTIAFRYLIRAAAVKSANDAATAIGEAISGSESAFADRMTQTARAMGMSKTTFKNAHGLTQTGHLSTARDMTTLGRHLFYDYPQYYNLFSRRSTYAGTRQVSNTNRRLLAAYSGADGIKTGYTRAAGSNLVASAHRGEQRVIATMFGGTSSAARNARVAELLDMGFERIPTYATVRKPQRPRYAGGTVVAALSAAVARSARPMPRPGAPDPVAVALTAAAPAPAAIAAAADAAVDAANAETPAPASQGASDAAAAVEAATAAVSAAAARATPTPRQRPAQITFSTASAGEAALSEEVTEVLTPYVSASDGRHWGIKVGLYPSVYEAQRVLLKTALLEIGTLDGALRKVVRRPTGFEANFVGLDAQSAALACQRLSARDTECTPFGP